MRRERHRLAGVTAVKVGQDNTYRLVNTMCLGGILNRQAQPSTPDPYDATLSKRSWEDRMIEWRHKLRCALEKATASESREDDIVGGGDGDIVWLASPQ
jgi:hypothetical protein